MSDVQVSDQTRVNIAVIVNGESWGEIRLKFFPDVAPNHVKNMVKLAQENFYDGTTFHRVIPGFMIQVIGDQSIGIFKDIGQALTLT